MKNEVITTEITDLTPEGFGVGRHENKVIFIADTAVGDTVEALVLKELKSHSFAKIQKLLTPSPDRIDPDCEISQKCGGCAFRHITYESELKLKQSIVKQAFSRIGKMDIAVNETVFGESERYRNKVQYPVAPDKEGKCAFGYYARRSHRIVPHDDCPLQDRVFTEIANFCVNTANKLGIDPYDESDGRGILRHIVMRKNRKGEILLCLVVADKNRLMLKKLADELSAKFDNIIGIHINVNKKRDNVIFGDYTFRICGEETLTDVLCGKEFEISPRAFYQVNADMAEKLYLRAKELASPKPEGGIILDLYCGAGTIGLCVAGENDKLCGVEIIDAAIENAKKNAERNGRSEENTLFVCGDASVGVEECRKKFGNPEIIIVDPPRKGLEKEVIETVVSASPERVVYISCDPATLARDCAIFAEMGYYTHEATPFDLFPRTGHVESVVLLSRQNVTHKMKLDDVPFSLIKSGQKTIELRLFDEKRRKICAEDTIVFTNTSTKEILTAEVEKLHRFDSFDQLYKNLPLLRCGYTAENADKAQPSDMEKYYSAEEQAKYGVVGIEISLPKETASDAHKYSINNKEMLQNDSVCGCFQCLQIFSPAEITEWIKDSMGTALCPYCSVDSVIGESSGYKITKEFLAKMKKHWF